MAYVQETLVGVMALGAAGSALWLWRRDVVRPGSLGRLEARGGLRNPATIHPGVWLGAGLATFLGAIVGGGMASAALGVGLPPPGAPPAEPDGASALVHVATYAAAAVVGVFCLLLIARSGRSLGTDERTLGLGCGPRSAIRGAGGLLLVFPLCMTVGAAATLLGKLVSAPTPAIGHTGLSEMVANRDTWHAWVKAAMAVVGAPVMEELVYRVFLQSAIISVLARLRAAVVGGPQAAAVASASDVFWGIVLSTAGFVLPHAGALNGPASWNALPSLVVLGAALGLVYERTRSPLAPIVMHAGFNAANVAAAMLLGLAEG